LAVSLSGTTSVIFSVKGGIQFRRVEKRVFQYTNSAAAETAISIDSYSNRLTIDGGPAGLPVPG
jgi:hypothetical protein